MTSSEETLQALRAALLISPQNLPLRQHIADTLLGLGQFEEAEHEYRQALALMPENQQVQLGLARTFYHQGKTNQAMVVVEALIKSPQAPAHAHLLYARLLLDSGDAGQAVKYYHVAAELDPSANDPELANRLGLVDETKHSNHVTNIANYSIGGNAAVETSVEPPAMTFKDVGGMEAIKEEIRLKIIHPLAHPEIYKAYGKRIGGGVLMYGPPGCGKTYLARATAGEIKAKFLSVGINDVLDMWLGSSEKNLHEFFQQARCNKPCVLFFDEVDALAAKRTEMRHSSGRQIINQFLAELDGVQASNDGILILAATNAPWHLDPAFRRPGRFDRILFVSPPDFSARAAILRILCRNKPIADIDYEHLSKKSENFSGADLQALVDLAVERKLQEAMKQGMLKPLTTKDLLAAAGTIKPSVTEWFSTARNYALHCNESGIYDDILTHMKLK